MIQIRQGDVFLKAIKRLPKGLSKKDNVLAWGETTGHKHLLLETANVFKNNKGQQFAELQQDTELQHEEHENIIIPKGIYEVRIQREYDLQEGVRSVRD